MTEKRRTLVVIPVDADDAASVYWQNFVWHIRQLVENGTIGNCRLIIGSPPLDLPAASPAVPPGAR